ncbi:TetR/AcrR family transcriptional regulator [Planosporangium mesophilum]|uniref:TetR family transcriptional regulator n=1 Tax=Planosporangium mesophilum TaxID=689768 RepID=A0A8J3TAU0_9ACTN|nr:TetR family transcriptional regulator [Planosporangium mesophilum]NJC84067.1 TetR/AcrR family transcriptional regulator [Planosporangium mesophilum]GII22929.1 TetR family transcriptional regulator [Planosporangium mesophilum]
MGERFADRVRRDLRSALLTATGELIVAYGFRRLRMADVAARVGVSRQTVYNEFGDKSRLAQALVLHETARLLDGIGAALNAYADPHRAIREAVRYVLQDGQDNPLVKASLTGDGAEELLPLITTRGEPVVLAARKRIVAQLRDKWSTPDAELVADTAVRLTVSHLVLPLDPPEHAAESVARVVSRLIPSEQP